MIDKLSAAEAQELADQIASGHISRSCKRAKIDWFNIPLSSGARCVGAYRWGSENGVFLRLAVYRKRAA